MSHIVQIQTEVRDVEALNAACRSRSLDPPEAGEFQIFQAQRKGLGVRLPKWRYPVVFNENDGSVFYDHFEGMWGDKAELDALLQAYAVEKVFIEARRQGHAVTQQRLEDGSVRLTVQLGGDV